MRRRPRSITGLVGLLARTWLSRGDRRVVLGAAGAAGVIALLGLMDRGDDMEPTFDVPDGAEICAKVRHGDEYGVVWGIEERPYQGVDLYFARFDSRGDRLGDVVDVGWGYHLPETTCGLAPAGQHYAVVWPHWDDVDNDAELSFARIAIDGSVVGRHQLDYTKSGAHLVDDFRARDAGFVLRFHTLFDDTPRVWLLDRDGNVIDHGLEDSP